MTHTIWCAKNQVNHYKEVIGAENIESIEEKAAPFTEYEGDRVRETYLSRILCNDKGYRIYRRKICKS